MSGNGNKGSRIGCRIDDDVRGWLAKAAAKQRTTISEIVRRIIHTAFSARRA